MERKPKKADATEYLLCGMYKNAKMGCENIVRLLPKVTDRFLKEELCAGFEKYSKSASEIERMMKERGIPREDPGKLAKIGAAAGIVFSVAVDPTSSGIARKYISDTKEGLRRLDRMCDEVMGDCDPRVVGYCTGMVEKERQSVAKMEAFL